MTILKNGKTQKEIVLERLLADGSVNNFWAFHNYILRLGAIIYMLREDGYKIVGMWGKDVEFLTPEEQETNRKNFFYILKKD